ncbi:tyrosine-type recombinase/integrase [Desulfotomaculum nigrificans]|uniref:tyrosine-type recombinase/integrase n=1 Tax=Desulfotomaculum nigrificans TaxID=1565 RepID=UPI0001FAE660|nr:site-specific integrase [Desulfotomaculum nigrificans]
MRPTDFSKSLTDFLTCYLPGEKGASKNTIASYKDTFILFLTFMKDEKGILADKVMLKHVNKEIVVDFLDWIEEKRHCCAATRNVRLAALHSFFQYLQYQSPENLLEWQRILSIPVKKTEKPSISYLSLEGIRLLLEQPDCSTRNVSIPVMKSSCFEEK